MKMGYPEICESKEHEILVLNYSVRLLAEKLVNETINVPINDPVRYLDVFLYNKEMCIKKLIHEIIKEARTKI
jgi:hypothetical protein